MRKSDLIVTIIGLFSPMIVLASDANKANDVHIRSLAASCAACHGTQGNTVRRSNSESTADNIPTLAGTQKDDIIAKLQAFKSGERSATVMHRHAKGLTADEITALAEYFSTQVPHAPALLTSQKLWADHAN